jgi:MFS family permease
MDLDRAVRRNTVLLAGAMAVNSATLQLVAAVSSLTFVLVTGVEGLLGLGPAIFLLSGALTSAFAGRAMDQYGRVPILALGFVAAATGAALTGLGAATSSTVAVILGFAAIGVGASTANLTRAAGGDMYPPERRARGISYVLFGSVFGAILGPAVFSPIFRGRDLEASELALPWFAASVIALVGTAIVLSVRPDPKRIAEILGGRTSDHVPPPAAPMRELLARPGVIPAMLAGVVTFAVMVAVMNLTGYVVVEHRHHPQHLVFPIIGAHVLGMYALVPVVGAFIDRIGRTPSLAGGLAVVAASCAGLVLWEGVAMTGLLLFGLGLGWNVSFVAATAQLADLAEPHERGKLLGFNDLLAGLTGAAFVLLGGFALDASGVAAMSLGAAVVALAPIAFVFLRGRSDRRTVPETG